jgi:molybdopterin-guanine dinucleotide biosynthesis protein A
MKLPGTVGLVLCGGQSARMGRDKGLIRYHQQPQREHTYNLLREICSEVYLSCKQVQLPGVPKGFNSILDLPLYSEIGPLGAILSALEQLPGKDILVVGCDYPFLTKEELDLFIHSIDDSRIAASFYDKTYEPTLAWYSHLGAKQLLEMCQSGEFSLRKYLIQVDAHRYFPNDSSIVWSIDTPAQSDRVYKTLERKPYLRWN